MKSIVISSKALQADLFMNFFADRRLLENTLMIVPSVGNNDFTLSVHYRVPVEAGRNGFGVGDLISQHRFQKDQVALRSSEPNDYTHVFIDWLEHVETTVKVIGKQPAYDLTVVPPPSEEEPALSDPYLIDIDGDRKFFTVGFYSYDDKEWQFYSDEESVDYKHAKYMELPLAKYDK